MRGKRVRLTVEGEERTGTVVSLTYTVKGGEPVAVVELDGGEGRIPAAPAELSPCA